MEKQEKTLEIELEVEHGVILTETIPVPNCQFTMASEVAFDILKELNGNCMRVYLTLLSHRNMRNNKCFPSIKRLNEKTGLSEKTIKRILTELYNAGYIVINSGYKGTNSNYYFPQEWFYAYFEDDINQRLAKRKDKTQVITEQRETKVEKENKALSKENEELKKQLMKANEQIKKMMKRKEQEDDEVSPVRKALCYKEKDDLDEDWF